MQRETGTLCLLFLSSMHPFLLLVADSNPQAIEIDTRARLGRSTESLCGYELYECESGAVLSVCPEARSTSLRGAVTQGEGERWQAKTQAGQLTGHLSQ